MKNRIKLSALLAILLLTLLLHLLFLYFFTTIPFSSAPERISEFIQNLLSKSEETPKDNPQLQAHTPQPSAPVIFRDSPEEPETPPQPKPEPIIEPKTLVSHANGPQDTPKKIESEKPTKPMQKVEPIEKTPPQKVEPPQNEIAKKKDTTESTPTEQIKEEAPISEPKKQKPNTQQIDPLILADLEEKPIHTTHKKTARPTPQEPKANQAEAEKTKTKNTQIKSAGSSKNNKKSKSISLADLTQQYMQKISASIDAASGYGSLRVEGNAQYGHPSAYQIALERYVAKMCKEIETSYRISTNQSLRSTQHKPFNLLVELDANGSISTMYPYPSSENIRIDEFAMALFRSASTSFPKLPEAMGQNLRIRFGIGHIDHLASLSQGVLQSQ